MGRVMLDVTDAGKNYASPAKLRRAHGSGFASGVDASLRRYARCRRGGMEDFVKHFCRNVDGSWTCTSSATLSGPNGRIQVAEGSRFYPGTSFMGFDLAKWLDQHVGGRAAPC